MSGTLYEMGHPPYSELKILLYKYCCTIWNSEYQASSKGTDYKILFPTIFSKIPPSGSRKYETILFRLRSGHCRLRAHLFKIGCSDTPLCEFCGRPETVEHLLLKCSEFEHQRKSLKSAVTNMNIPFTRNSILTDPRLQTPTVEFILTCGKTI